MEVVSTQKRYPSLLEVHKKMYKGKENVGQRKLQFFLLENMEYIFHNMQAAYEI